MEVRGLVDPLVNWVKEGSDGNWSPSHPTDAQRESILFLCGAFLLILVFWQVTPFRTSLPLIDWCKARENRLLVYNEKNEKQEDWSDQESEGLEKHTYTHIVAI